MSEIFLSRIAIQDFRTFGNFEIDIPAAPGLVLLTGTNGLGKSSFFDAIEWGLTGKIRRFEPYLQKGRKKLLESDYLTRRGAEPGSHSVSLTFSGNDAIERSSSGGTKMADIIAQLAHPERRAIDDLGIYLALTHFLGQAAQQRFTSRDPNDQWEALKGPSGIDRLERIRAGLRGRSTIAAFTRRLDKEKGAVDRLARQIADWQGWTTRLNRLRVALRATGVVSADELTERIDQIEIAYYQLVPTESPAVAGDSADQRLAALGERIATAMLSLGERKSELEALSKLPAQYAVSLSEARTDHPNLVRLRQAVSEARARYDLAVPQVESTSNAVTAQKAAITSIDQTITVLDAARADLARRAQLVEILASEARDRQTLAQTIAAQRKKIAEADDAIGRHGEAAAEVARLKSQAGSARQLSETMAECLTLEAEASAADAALAKGREAASQAEFALNPLEQTLVELETRIGDAERERAEADRHASAISAALSQLARHLHSDDTDCPVCQTSFEPGAIKSLAEAAASGSDSRLSHADEMLETLRSERSVLNDHIGRLRAEVAAVEGLESSAAEAARAVADTRAGIAQALSVSPNSDLPSLVAGRVREADSALAVAQSSLDSLTAGAAAAVEQRSAATSDLTELTVRHSEMDARVTQRQAEDKACADRIAARNLSTITMEELEAQLTHARARGEAANKQLAKLNEAASAAVAEVAREQAALDAAEREVNAAESTRKSAEQAAQQLQERWTRAGLDNSPTEGGYDRGRTAIETAMTRLQSLSEQQLVLARVNEEALLQSEIDEILASMRAMAGDEGIRDPIAYSAGLAKELEVARAAVKATNATRSAVKRYTEDLKAQADAFSARVLDPLNTVIDDFNEAMLSTPGESIQFKADTRVDATSFGMALRYREKVENAIEAKKDLPPQVVLSEGQLAANGFSILCAASTAYPWSRWRALLLDDPLQHNDIIHTAAFVDLMRNMVELNGYQLIMSSHDRGESEFIARKFDAAGIPCSTILLTAPSENGVVWVPPEQNTPAAKILRRDAAATGTA